MSKPTGMSRFKPEQVEAYFGLVYTARDDSQDPVLKPLLDMLNKPTKEADEFGAPVNEEVEQ